MVLSLKNVSSRPVRQIGHSVSRVPRQSVRLWHKKSCSGKARFGFGTQNKKNACLAPDSVETATSLETVHVRVMITLSISFGEHLCLAGSCEELGSWNVENAPKFQWTNGDLWVVDLELPPATRAEFKIVHVIPSTGEHIWEYTCNRVLEVPDAAEMKDGEISLVWCDENTHGTVVKPIQMSTLASWDEEDIEQIAPSSPFASVSEFFSYGTNKGDPIEQPVDPQVPILESLESIEEDTVTGLAEYDEDNSVVVGSDDISENITGNFIVTEENLEESSGLSVPEEEKSGVSSLKKAATAAGMVAAGVAGAALLSGLAVDVADTAVLGAFAVAAGSAAFGTKTSGKPETEEGTMATSDNDKAEKALSKEPGTIIAAGLAAAFDQAQGKKVINEDNVSPEENE